MKTTFFPTTIFFLFITILFSSCNDEENLSKELVKVSILNNKEVTFTSMEIDVTITYQSENEIIERGIAWSTTPNPTIDNNTLTETANTFTSFITDLTVNTAYFFRAYITNSNGTVYSEEKSFKTLSFDNTRWKITTVYPDSNDYEIVSQVDFFEDGTTKFDELGTPGVYITYGSWSLNGNNLTYIWEGEDANSSTQVYTGVISDLRIQGTYTHIHRSDGPWSATPM
ncbi:hypothetical protein P8625_12840 [Tenacibaculum tangerinum]|uniref:Fibronectin type-III domain-containing protein n=1 Tax=Tenacibaculum tangerinum TaxID=3038772 RepID=A0ABY8L4K2_9FLAO|nr:hypothetical protein [Tenacibaculum tangerinum]WGH74954.1 hypothetical protein P8625_12840 [Tenacibaculum tangerinum]